MSYLNCNSGINKVVKMRKANYQSVAFFLFVCICLACKNNSKQKATALQKTDTVLISDCQTEQYLKEKIRGSWSIEGDCITWMHITEDSIYFVDEWDENGNPIAISYSISNDSIKFYDGFKNPKDKIAIIDDSLIFIYKDSKGKYIRVR